MCIYCKVLRFYVGFVLSRFAIPSQGKLCWLCACVSMFYSFRFYQIKLSEGSLCSLSAQDRSRSLGLLWVPRTGSFFTHTVKTDQAAHTDLSSLGDHIEKYTAFFFFFFPLPTNEPFLLVMICDGQDLLHYRTHIPPTTPDITVHCRSQPTSNLN